MARTSDIPSWYRLVHIRIVSLRRPFKEHITYALKEKNGKDYLNTPYNLDPFYTKTGEFKLLEFEL